MCRRPDSYSRRHHQRHVAINCAVAFQLTSPRHRRETQNDFCGFVSDSFCTTARLFSCGAIDSRQSGLLAIWSAGQSRNSFADAERLSRNRRNLGRATHHGRPRAASDRAFQIRPTSRRRSPAIAFGEGYPVATSILRSLHYEHHLASRAAYACWKGGLFICAPSRVNILVDSAPVRETTQPPKPTERFRYQRTCHPALALPAWAGKENGMDLTVM